ncbi:MAG TPA: TerC family protein [Candidatus Binatia bacterium]|nr:TerC family protein [Candidatus Binatia bacterium]
MDSVWFLVGFNVFILLMLAIDLGLFQREAHEVPVREALAWSITWIVLSLSFNLAIYWFRGSEKALEFLTGYLIEYALSVDNIFVFVMIFAYFGVPSRYQHRILFWGILGALLLRGLMIGMGAILIQRFHWVTYIFGGFLVFTGIRMALQDEQAIEPESNPVIHLVRRFLRVTNVYHGQKFFVREELRGGRRTGLMATPLFVVLVLVETTDVIFALDSIPAIFAVTRDPMIVYTSNVFAILGLRALYFLLAGVIRKFHYLQLGLSAILVFVGVKMLIADIYNVPIGWSLLVVAAVLSLSVIASLLFPKPEGEEPASADSATHEASRETEERSEAGPRASGDSR